MTTTLGTSLPSLPVTSVDTQGVQNLNAEFIYNYFTPDELLNDNGIVAVPTNGIAFQRTVPRAVRLTWSKVNISSTTKLKPELVDISIAENADKVLDEDEFFLKFFSSFQQQEVNFVIQTQLFLDRLYKQLGYSRVNASLTDAIRALHESTPENLSEEFIARYLNYTCSSVTTTTTAPVNPLSQIEKIGITQPISNKTYGTLLHEKLVTDSLVPITNYAVDALFSKVAVQASVKPYENRLNGSQYDLKLGTALDTTVADFQNDFGFIYQTTGYIVERYRLQDDRLVEKQTFYIENPDTVEYLDTQVRYNQRYIYNIKAVTVVQTLTFSPMEKVNGISTFLLAGKPVRVDAKCVDNKPAPPPTDFFVRWDESLKKPVLTWNYPIDGRRHIKYFQVFRRKNVGDTRPAQLPFELIAMYDFNDLQEARGTFYDTAADGTFLFYTGEDSIDSNLIVRQSSVSRLQVFTPTCLIDDEFTKEDYYIYAVAAVDAHGITTNYSNQIGVKYNSRMNSIERVDISAPNAPKPYPNLYLNKDAFVDTIKNEGYSQVTVVFNPEYLDLANQTGDDLRLWRYGPTNLYRLQLINTDIQKDQFIDIKIIDDRNSA